MICTKCEIEKPLEEFPRLGKSRWCKACFKSYWYFYHKPRKRLDKKRQQLAIRTEMIHVYGGKCDCCGESTPEFLTIDHINGGGNQHRKELGRTGWRFYLWLKKQGWPKEIFQLLYMNCNMAKHHFGGCPHERSVLSPLSMEYGHRKFPMASPNQLALSPQVRILAVVQ